MFFLLSGGVDVLQHNSVSLSLGCHCCGNFCTVEIYLERLFFFIEKKPITSCIFQSYLPDVPCVRTG